MKTICTAMLPTSDQPYSQNSTIRCDKPATWRVRTELFGRPLSAYDVCSRECGEWVAKGDGPADRIIIEDAQRYPESA